MRHWLPATSLAALVVVSTPAQAQDAVLSAQVVDGETGAPVAEAAIVVSAPGEEQPVAAGVTASDGRVSLSGLPEGDFLLSVAASGYQPAERGVLVGAVTTALDLGRIALAPAGATQIVVTGAREQGINFDPGVTSFSLAEDALAQSGSVLSAMKALPGISVEQEGTVLLRGSDRVVILIDGKPSALTGVGNQTSLDSLPASNIDRIEIITNPSARYGAQGGAGIINIVMREEREAGLSGHVGLKGGFGALTRRRADLPTELGSYDWTPKIAPYLSLTHSGDSADYQLQGELLKQRRLPNNEFTTRFYDDGRVIVSQVPENRRQTHYVLKGGTDQRLSDDDTLSINGVFDLENHIDVAQVPFIEQGTGTLTRFWFWRENEQTGHASANVTYRHDFAEAGHYLSARAEFIRGWEDETYRLNEVSPVRVGTDQTRIIATENTVPIQLDYVRPMRRGRIEAGAKLQFRWLPVTYEVVPGVGSIIYPGLGERSDWDENIYAGYVNGVFDLPWLTIEAGLRAEHTDVSYTLDPANIYYPRDDAYSYFRLFPNVRLTKHLGEDTRLSLFYNRRVDRPGEPELRVFAKYDDPELLKVGNPYLRPQFTTAYEASLQQDWDGLKGSLAIYHRQISDAFQRIYAIDETSTQYDIINKIFHNTGEARNTGAELIAQWKANGGLTLNGSLNAYRLKLGPALVTLLFPYVREVLLEGSDDFTWDAKLGAEIGLGSSTKLQANGVYYASREIAQGRQSARGSFDLALTRSFADERFKLGLTATDIFNTFGTKTRVDGIGFEALYENYYETQIVMLSLEYSL